MTPPGQSATRPSRWPYLSLIPIGLGAWAPIYAGVKARAPLWVALGVLWCVLVIAGFVENSTGGHSGSDDLAGFLIIAGWVGAIATSFTVRSTFEQRMSSPLLQAAEAGELRLRDRARARRLARENPTLAREIGIGRPDRHGATDGGLVDVNNASITALLTLPGVDGDLATRIVETRQKIRGFASLEDMGVAMDLDGALVEGLRDDVIFLPRGGPA